MASPKLAAAALAVVLLVCAAATTATAYRAQPQPQPKPEPEDCKRQAEYFKNCLRLGLKEKCCGNDRVVPVAERRCYCEVEREAEIQCALGRRCGGVAKKIKVAEMHLPCLEDLHCTHA